MSVIELGEILGLKRTETSIEKMDWLVHLCRSIPLLEIILRILESVQDSEVTHYPAALDIYCNTALYC